MKMAKTNHETNPLDCLTKERISAIEKAIVASNNEVNKVGLEIASFHVWNQKAISWTRRSCFIGNLQIQLRGLPDIEIVEISNVLLIILDHKVAMYVRKISEENLTAGVPKLFNDGERVIIAQPDPTQYALAGFEDLLKLDPDLGNKVSVEDALRLKDLAIILCGYIGQEPGLVEKVYITQQLDDVIIRKYEIDPSTAQNISYLHDFGASDLEDDGPTIFGIDDSSVDADNINNDDSAKAAGDE